MVRETPPCKHPTDLPAGVGYSVIDTAKAAFPDMSGFPPHYEVVRTRTNCIKIATSLTAGWSRIPRIVLPAAEVRVGTFRDVLPAAEVRVGMFRDVLPASKVRVGTFRDVLPASEVRVGTFRDVLPASKVRVGTFRDVLPASEVRVGTFRGAPSASQVARGGGESRASVYWTGVGGI